MGTTRAQRFLTVLVNQFYHYDFFVSVRAIWSNSIQWLARYHSKGKKLTRILGCDSWGRDSGRTRSNYRIERPHCFWLPHLASTRVVNFSFLNPCQTKQINTNNNKNKYKINNKNHNKNDSNHNNKHINQNTNKHDNKHDKNNETKNENIQRII